MTIADEIVDKLIVHPGNKANLAGRETGWKGGEKFRTEALLAHLESRFEPLGLSFKFPNLPVAKRNHAPRVGQPSRLRQGSP